MTIYRIFVLVLAMQFFISSCKKDHKSEAVVIPSDTFSISINGKTWNPSKFSATYYSKWHQLYINAYDQTYAVTVGVNVDSGKILNRYDLECNGNNEAYVVENGMAFYSSHNMTDAGGTFELNRFDTSLKKLEGTFSFVGYTSDLSKEATVSSIHMKDISYVIDAFNYDGNTASCIINGAKTSKWQPKDISAQVGCGIGNSKETLEVIIYSILGQSRYSRHLKFKIPLEFGLQSFPVYSDVSPTNDCYNRVLTSLYKLGTRDYFPSSGYFKTVYLNRDLKNIRVEFDITYKDTVTQNEIHITNGVMNLNPWKY